MQSALDHLVVLAQDLQQAEQHCVEQLGVPTSGGGEHPLMATHNRLLRITSSAYPRAYLEWIAIHPTAIPQRAAAQKRWFDMDDLALQAEVARDGPRLIHWVARVSNLREALDRWAALGIDRGKPVLASRATPAGELRWQISVRDDGQRLFDGCLPTLIEWGERHPADTMPDSGVRIDRLVLQHHEAGLLQRAFDTIGLRGIVVHVGPAQRAATLVRGEQRVEWISREIGEIGMKSVKSVSDPIYV